MHAYIHVGLHVKEDKVNSNQIKSNHLFRQADTKKNVDKMSNEKA